jgi:hypothetical protein
MQEHNCEWEEHNPFHLVQHFKNNYSLYQSCAFSFFKTNETKIYF